jgi:hypothetical protein
MNKTGIVIVITLEYAKWVKDIGSHMNTRAPGDAKVHAWREQLRRWQWQYVGVAVLRPVRVRVTWI